MFIKLNSFNGDFEINEHAEIRSRFGKIINPYIGTDMYQHVCLCWHGKKYRKRVHRLMAEAFFNNCALIDHIDNNKSNNELTNLRPITNGENVLKGNEDAKKYHSGYQVKVKCINKTTKEIYYANSMRDAERYTGIDRHRIKTFLRNERNNYTNYNFEYLEEV